YLKSVYTPDNVTNLYPWGSLYKSIRSCNVFINGVKKSKSLKNDRKWKEKRLGEARFLRAYFYMLLWTHYGGVPIITKALNRLNDKNLLRPRSTAKETFQFIDSELEDIVGDLPIDAENGHISRGAVLTLKA